MYLPRSIIDKIPYTPSYMCLLKDLSTWTERSSSCVCKQKKL